MRELRLQVNVTFYTTVAIMVMSLLTISLFITKGHSDSVLKGAMLMSFILIGAINLNLIMTLSGKRQASMCNNGLFYTSAFGRHVYIPVEGITHISVRKFCGIKLTKVSTIDGDVHFLTMQFSNTQEDKLREFGYLAQ
ncbi:hypothetical protein [Pseudoalteromonas sp. MMG022]|uniref:hypothetical protein n=1 Tax=Pseudoalteromonas sp. MMG022 TaxID=2909978 RepID=UPI001F16E949|nr:hypothetical protein [Pseudoalteromonas sp. MMG022]MCF6435191.1 hypothetical protein [Pseudoalteromonas sp. MMG022]